MTPLKLEFLKPWLVHLMTVSLIIEQKRFRDLWWQELMIKSFFRFKGGMKVPSEIQEER